MRLIVPLQDIHPSPVQNLPESRSGGAGRDHRPYPNAAFDDV